MKILIATSNKQKTSEITTILRNEKNIAWEFISLPALTPPDEPYASFIENAIHKAKYYANLLNVPALSEDTGLCISALNQFPGIHTKDFIEQHCNIEHVIEVLQQKLQHTKDRRATYVTAVALYLPTMDWMLSYEAKEFGHLSFPPRGAPSFGFDAIFVPEGKHQTIAELGIDIKNRDSHRALAIKGLLEEFSIVPT